MSARTRLAELQREAWRQKRADVLAPAHPPITSRKGTVRADPDAPTPPGRWCYLAIGLHVSPFWLEAMKRWHAAGL